MSYTHLTEDERYHIYEAIVQKKSIRLIAKELSRDPSSISREINRNKGLKGYRPKQAQMNTDERKIISSKNAARVDPKIWPLVSELIRKDWSPEQISGRLNLENQGQVSHESIYLYIYADKASGGTLHKHLRIQKKRRKRYASGNSRRGKIPNRVGIEHRPNIVEKKERLGDWEGDTIIGKAHQQAIVSIVDRASKLTLLVKVDNKKSDTVSQAMHQKLLPFAENTHTITLDNGLEFSDHGSVSEKIGCSIFFARPYASWQRGLNEHTNGLVRQYFPKKSEFTAITQKDVDHVAEKLNNRPRKVLGYNTPLEVYQFLNKINHVAPRS